MMNGRRFSLQSLIGMVCFEVSVMGWDLMFIVDRGSAFRCTLLPLYVDRSFRVGGVLMMGQLCGLLTPCDVFVWVPAGVSAGNRAWGRGSV